MNPTLIAEIAKILKGLLVAAGLLGVNISPDNQVVITESVLALVSVIYMVEAFAKNKKRKTKPQLKDTL